MAPTPSTPSDKSTPEKLMELSVDRNHLLTEVTAAARVTDSKGTKPVLQHLLLEATKDGLLTITGSDMNRSLRTDCPAEVKTAGAATVHAQKFLTYLKLLPNSRLSLKLLANNRVQVHAGSSRSQMPGLAASEFPAFPAFAPNPVRLSCRALRTVLRQSLFAVATSEDRYLLNTALLILSPDRVGMVATDGHRLSLIEMPEDSLPVDGPSKSLLPRACVTDLLSLLSATKEEAIEFSQDDSNVYFRLGPQKLSVRKLVGKFPEYDAILPRDHTSSTVIRNNEFTASIQRVLEFADQRTNGVKLHLAENSLTISSSGPDHGESEEVLSVNYGFPPVTIGFNGNYLLEFLKTIGDKGEMRLSLKDAKSAGMLIPESMSAEYRQCYVVMPMRV